MGVEKHSLNFTYNFFHKLDTLKISNYIYTPFSKLVISSFFAFLVNIYKNLGINLYLLSSHINLEPQKNWKDGEKKSVNFQQYIMFLGSIV